MSPTAEILITGGIRISVCPNNIRGEVMLLPKSEAFYRWDESRCGNRQLLFKHLFHIRTSRNKSSETRDFHYLVEKISENKTTTTKKKQAHDRFNNQNTQQNRHSVNFYI